ncbi:MAG: hypothetical protein IPG99_02430 [Ignavibacteria bacterium]|nr:hypothetical protein [Ignavibacteria bacterium]MBK9225470.1 hypothetical protein [Ignavibacteria bacterium]
MSEDNDANRISQKAGKEKTKINFKERGTVKIAPYKTHKESRPQPTNQFAGWLNDKFQTILTSNQTLHK